MKTWNQILLEAPISKQYDMSLAFGCANCPWWCSSWETPRKSESGVLHCLKCDGRLREFPLTDFVHGVKENNSENFEGFIACHSDNWDLTHDQEGKLVLPKTEEE